MPWKIFRVEPRRRRSKRLRRRQIGRAVAGVPLPLALRQEAAERLGERVGVERGLDLEDLRAVVAHHLAHPPVALVELGAVLVHERMRRLHRLRVVMVAERAVRGEAGGRRLPAAVHGDQVDVDVDEQVGLGGPLVDLDLLTLRGRAEEGEVVGILGVVLVEESAWFERVVDPVAERVAQFELVHPAVQRERADDVDVVDAGVRGHGQHLLHDALTDVGPLHLRQRQAHVVERDGQLHPGEQQRRQRVHVDRVEQAVADGAVDVVDRVVRFGGVDHPAAVGGELLEAEPFAVPEQRRRRRTVDVEYESRTGHQRRSCLSGDEGSASDESHGRVAEAERR